MGKRVKKHAKKVGILVVAVLFLIIGVAGLVLPILNGIIFLLLSLVLFSIYSETAKKLLHRIGSAHPKAASAVHKMEAWIARQIGDTD